MITYKQYLEGVSIMRMSIYYCSPTKEFNPREWEYCFTSKTDAEKYAKENNLHVMEKFMIGAKYPKVIDGNNKDYNIELQRAKNDIEVTDDYDFIVTMNMPGFDSKNLILAHNIILLNND